MVQNIEDTIVQVEHTYKDFFAIRPVSTIIVFGSTVTPLGGGGGGGGNCLYSLFLSLHLV